MKPNLKVVGKGAATSDIYAAWKAEIAARDWGAVHTIADRRAPVDIPQTRKGWRR